MASLCEVVEEHFLGKQEYILGPKKEYCELPGHELGEKYPFPLDRANGLLGYGMILPIVPGWTNSGQAKFDSFREVINLGNYIEMVIQPDGTRKLLYPAEFVDGFPENNYIPARVAYLNKFIGSAKTRTLTDLELYHDSPERLKEILGGNLKRSDCSKINEKTIDEVLALVIYPSVEIMEAALKREDILIDLDKLDPDLKVRLGR